MLGLCNLSLNKGTAFALRLFQVSQKMIWSEKERSKIRAVMMNKFRNLLVIWRIDRMPNAQVRDQSGMKKRGRWKEWRIEGFLKGYLKGNLMEVG